MKRLTTTLAATILMAATAWSGLKPGRTEGWYGVNYTVPFAHAYRAIDRLGLDHKAVIDEDISHWKRLGLDAFRLHLWDVELTDSAGTLLANEHLDLLDYLLARAAANGIDIIITAQTNFGNGYPERNTNPNGAFTYRWPKNRVHEEPEAQAAQERYLKALATHVNPYTGKAWKDDPAILAMEVNNEPTHSGTPAEITAYINRMAKALRKAGWKKPVLYNVSHNLDRTRGYYDADIDGVTYQWYPVGLVAGHTRTGNFLPALDQYDWRATLPADATPAERKRWEALPRIFYEFDPADNLMTYLYPAVARTMRKEGFDWLTQFAYDPTPIANVNTEYQTHYLNLLYTPGKAIGMMIAGEAMRRLPKGIDYGKYPADTVFGPFLVSGRRNLAVLNDGESFIYTGSNSEQPLNGGAGLKRVAGVGSSAVVDYDGSGAYFLDRRADGGWDVEVMPDVVYLADPFATASPRREVARLVSNQRTMRVRLPGLDTVIIVKPEIKPVWGTSPGPQVQVAKVERSADGHRITATIVGEPDSVTVYPASINFWRDHNPLLAMAKTGPMQWEATADGGKPLDALWVVAWKEGRPMTWPGNLDIDPLDWTFNRGDHPPYSFAAPGLLPLALMTAEGDAAAVELSTVPGTWQRVRFEPVADAVEASRVLRLTSEAPEIERFILTRNVAPLVAATPDAATAGRLTARFGRVEGVKRLVVSVVNGDGFTYGAEVTPDADGVATVALDRLQLMPTQLVPEPFPAFLTREFKPDAATATPLRPADIMDVTVVAWPADAAKQPVTVELRSLVLE